MINIRFLILSTLVYFLFSCQEGECSFNSNKQGALTPVNMSFALSDPIQAGDVPSSSATTKSVISSPFSVSYIASSPKTKSSTTFSNVWILQFNSIGTCVKATNLGIVSTTNINPTLISGSGYTIYIIANGPSASNAFDTSTTKYSLENSLIYSESIIGDAPYIGRLDGVTISSDGILNSGSSQSPTILLTRIAAKVSLSLNYNVSGYTLQSVEMYNAPKNMYYLYGYSTSIFPGASTSNINQSALTANVKPSTATSGTYIWYVGENKRGINTDINTPYNKDFLHTPTANSSQYYCTYIHIKALKDDDSGRTINYYIYPGSNSTSDFNLIRNYDYNLNVVIQGNSVAQESMDGVDGRVRIATSNSYMMTPGSTITIPVNIKGNSNKPLMQDPTDITTLGNVTHSAASVKLLWQTSVGLITSISNVYNGKVNITASSNSGNAVVAAYSGANGTGTILWSWHIWVTDYLPLTGTTYTFNGYTWLDRNLGAQNTTIGNAGSFGLLYQYGRKDPFPGSSSAAYVSTTPVKIYNFSGTELAEDGTGVVKVATTAVTNLPNTILNPLTFYTASSDGSTVATETHDWYSSSVDIHSAYLWCNANGTKSIFDPCPIGWCVPRDFVWNGLAYYWNTTYLGFQSSTVGWYPAAGLRLASSGNIGDVGVRGLVWLGSIDGGNSHGYWDYSPSRSILNGAYHAWGMSIRCIKE